MNSRERVRMLLKRGKLAAVRGNDPVFSLQLRAERLLRRFGVRLRNPSDILLVDTL
jgi:archaeosine-15-forming tRNA-guanine transglycosylase